MEILIYLANSQVLCIAVHLSAWKKGPIASKAYATKGTYLLLPGFSELEITNERGMALLEISINNLMVDWKEKKYKSSHNLKAKRISSVFIILVSDYILSK